MFTINMKENDFKRYIKLKTKIKLKIKIKLKLYNQRNIKRL